MDNLTAKKVADELKRGREITRQLYLNMPSSSTETIHLLVQNILSSFEKALSFLDFNSSTRDLVMCPTGVIPGMSESPTTLNQDVNPENHPTVSSRKRNSIARWKEQVRVSPGMGLEGPLDDGFCWRKYGQKQIHGSKNPRGYYRCIQRDVKGCLATKQVQRSDEDPTIFNITYYANHTCTQQPPGNQEPADFLAPNQEFLFDSNFQTLNQSSFEFPSTSDITMADQSQQVFSVNDLATADTFMTGNLFSQYGSDFQNCDQSNISAAVATDSARVTGFDFDFEFEFNPNLIFDHNDQF